MEWWRFFFTVMFGLPLAALVSIWMAGQVVSLRPRLRRIAVPGSRTGQTANRGGGHSVARREAAEGATRIAAFRTAAESE